MNRAVLLNKLRRTKEAISQYEDLLKIHQVRNFDFRPPFSVFFFACVFVCFRVCFRVCLP